MPICVHVWTIICVRPSIDATRKADHVAAISSSVFYVDESRQRARARGHIGNARARLYGVLAFSRKSAILAEEAFDRTEIGHEKLGDHPRTNAGLQTPKNADRRSRPITCVYFFFLSRQGFAGKNLERSTLESVLYNVLSIEYGPESRAWAASTHKMASSTGFLSKLRNFGTGREHENPSNGWRPLRRSRS